MITDTSILQDLQTEWQGVLKLRGKMDRLLKASFSQGASATVLLADIPHNLPFLNACGVFNDALMAMRKAGYFSSQWRTLGALVKDSKNSLPWLNYLLMKEVVDKRNDLAHRAVILPRGDCWRYIDAIEVQLRDWKVLT